MKIKRLYNLGIESGVIDDLNIVEDIDALLPMHEFNEITYGHSKDHRADLKQVAQELMVTQDGGVPILCKILDGNAADTLVFKERTKAIIKQFIKSGSLIICSQIVTLHQRER